MDQDSNPKREPGDDERRLRDLQRGRSRFGPHRRWRLGFLVKAVCALLCVGVLGAAVMLLWNWVVPPIFAGAAEIGFWRALGLLVLCRILFGGFRGRHGGWHEKKRRMRERWEAMTPEERARVESRCFVFGRRGRSRDEE